MGAAWEVQEKNRGAAEEMQGSSGLLLTAYYGCSPLGPRESRMKSSCFENVSKESFISFHDIWIKLGIMKAINRKYMEALMSRLTQSAGIARDAEASREGEPDEVASPLRV